MNLTPSRQRTIKTYLHAKVDAIVPIVFQKPYYFGSKQDVAARAGVAWTANFEAKFAMLRLRGFRDLKTDIGCDDPTTVLNYILSVFYEYKAIRDDVGETNSRDDFEEAIILLRSSFNGTQTIIENIATHGLLIPIGNIAENQETIYLKGTKGDLYEFLVEVEVT